MTQKPLISAQNLSVHYALRGSLIGPTPFVRAVENVSLEIAPGSFFWPRWRIWFRQNHAWTRDAACRSDQQG